MFDGEPVVPDSRLERVSMALRAKYPDLPESASFVTWVGDPEPARINGIETVARLARFAIVLPHPRNPEFTKIIPAVTLFSDFRAKDKDHGHYVDSPDPLLTVYTARPPGGRSVIEEAVNWSRNMAARAN